MFRFLIITVIAITMTGGCCLHDARTPASTCAVHQKAMKPVTVAGWGGCVLPTVPYSEARNKSFPNAGRDYLPSPWPWKRERVYVCDDCIRARDEWIKS